MPKLPADTLKYLKTSPYDAMLEGRDRQAQDLFFAKFEKLPDALREFLLSPKTAEDVEYLALTTHLDDRYLTALGKIIASVTLGEVPIGSVAALLEKLDLPPEQAAAVADGMTRLMEPVLAAKARAAIGIAPREMPPLTRVVPPAAGPQGAGRNIIDLRKPAP
jgi:hypothetical protein